MLGQFAPTCCLRAVPRWRGCGNQAVRTVAHVSRAQARTRRVGRRMPDPGPPHSPGIPLPTPQSTRIARAPSFFAHQTRRYRSSSRRAASSRRGHPKRTSAVFAPVRATIKRAARSDSIKSSTSVGSLTSIFTCRSSPQELPNNSSAISHSYQKESAVKAAAPRPVRTPDEHLGRRHERSVGPGGLKAGRSPTEPFPFSGRYCVQSDERPCGGALL
jgi:hypothetical protein